jgi:hypothetical protein
MAQDALGAARAGPRPESPPAMNDHFAAQNPGSHKGCPYIDPQAT